MRRNPILAALTILAVVGSAACGGGDDDAGAPDGGDTSTTSTTSTIAEAAGGDDGEAAATQLLGEPTQFGPGGGGAEDVPATVAGRACEIEEALFGSCRASTGDGGPFLV